MMMGVYESARCHEVVHLPMQTRANPLDLMVEAGQLPVQYAPAATIFVVGLLEG